MKNVKTFLNEPLSITGFSFCYYQQVNLQEEIKRHIYKQLYVKPSESTSSLPAIKISYHAWIRWNECIGPTIGWDELKRLCGQLALLPKRIQLFQNYGLIDEDICFLYTRRDDEVEITTFYGRLCLYPKLIRLLKDEEGLLKDNPISFSPSILKRQTAPIVPVELITYESDDGVYQLEKYQVMTQHGTVKSIFFLLNVTTKTVISFDLKHLHQSMLSKVTLYVLWVMGYEKLVIDHMNVYYSKKQHADLRLACKV